VSDRSKAIFVSYASDDEQAAQRLHAGLSAAGFETWFDRNELRGGDAWDARIRQQIRDCTLFVPIISANTEARSEGYFRLEWRLAVDRSLQMADDRAFLVPIAIDATAQEHARVPERFRERHWALLPRGETSPEFIAHLRRVLDATPAPSSAGSHAATPTPPWRRPARRRGLAAAALVLGALGIAALLIGLHRSAVAPRASGGDLTAITSAVRAPDRKSIAVLPFENLTGRPEDAYLADGLQEEILNALARIRDLKVISRTSVGEYRGGNRNVHEISDRLGVGSVLEGSVRRDATTLRLTLQLIDAHDDRHLLATNYDRELSHILGLQSEVAREVAEALAATLTTYERGELEHVGTNNGDAYRSYLRAVAVFLQPVPGDDMGAIRSAKLLEEAVRLDPEYADAWALLSQVHSRAYVETGSSIDSERAKSAFERALAIEPDLVDARMARGLYALYVVRDRTQALGDLEPVAQVRPNSPAAQGALALALRRLGRMTESLPYFERAWDLDPLSHAWDFGPISTFIGLRRYPEGIEQARLMIKRFPDNSAGYVTAARIAAFVMQSPEPLRALMRERGASFDGNLRTSLEAEVATAEGRYQDAIGLWQSRTDVDPSYRLAALGFLYRAAGDTAASETQFHSLERELQSKSGEGLPLDLSQKLALAQSMLGEHAAATRTIERARERYPESLDPLSGPQLSFTRSVVLARAGRTAEAYAEVERLLHVPFAAPSKFFVFDDPDPVYLLLKDDPHYDALIHHPPRL